MSYQRALELPILLIDHNLQSDERKNNWSLKTRPGLLEAWLVLTSVKYHGNLYILIPLNQRLALTRLRATGPRLQAHSFSDRWSVSELKHLIRIKVAQNNLIQPFCAKTVIAFFYEPRKQPSCTDSISKKKCLRRPQGNKKDAKFI